MAPPVKLLDVLHDDVLQCVLMHIADPASLGSLAQSCKQLRVFIEDRADITSCVLKNKYPIGDEAMRVAARCCECDVAVILAQDDPYKLTSCMLIAASHLRAGFIKRLYQSREPILAKIRFLDGDVLARAERPLSAEMDDAFVFVFGRETVDAWNFR